LYEHLITFTNSELVELLHINLKYADMVLGNEYILPVHWNPPAFLPRAIEGPDATSLNALENFSTTLELSKDTISDLNSSLITLVKDVIMFSRIKGAIFLDSTYLL